MPLEILDGSWREIRREQKPTIIALCEGVGYTKP